MPDPIDESRFAALKGWSAPGSKPVSKNARGKKRSASGEVKAPSRKKTNLGPPLMSGALPDKPAKVNGTPKTNVKKTAQSLIPASARKSLIDSSDEAVDDEVDDFASLSDGDAKGALESFDEEEDEVDLDKNRGDFLDSDSDVYDSDPGAMFSEDEDTSDAEEKLTAANIEGLSRRLDTKKAREAAEAQLEQEEEALQTNIAGERPKILEDDLSEDEDGRTKTNLHLAPDLQVLRSRITDTIRVLDDFAQLAEPGRARAEYTAQLLRDICAYYGYSSFLAEKLLDLFPPRDAFAFFEANESPRPVVLRANTLKTHRRELAQALIGRGVTLEPVGKWSKVGLQIFESPVPLGATPEYLAGHYMLQAASSFLPVMALAPQPRERVLDMAAAPGGKTTHMAALMRNTGSIFANDANASRAKALVANIHRLGARNTIVCSYDARAFPTVMGGFDRVLLDAPCSGTGVIAKDPSVKTNKTEHDFLALPHMQKQLLLAAIDSVDHASKSGGFLVYSTCSVTVEENEKLVAYALSRRSNVRIVETGLPFGVPAFTSFRGTTFPKDMNLARRYYPHTYNVDGFFVCKLQKISPTPANAVKVTPTGAIPGTDPASRINGVSGTKAVNGKEEMNGMEAVRNADDPNGGNGTADVSVDGRGAKKEDDDFGGWDSEEDAVYLERARKKSLKKKGIDPKSVGRQNKGNGK
jgi:25S rRNA (cytosine2870-C5)-methyltransferase